MRAVLIGFALGIVGLQQRATLPGAWEWCALSVVFASSCGFACWARFRPVAAAPRAARWQKLAASWVVSVAAVNAGYAYAAVRAQMRMAEALPAAWESRGLVLKGYVRGLPIQDPASARFLFAVDIDEMRRATGIERFPSIVQLSWAGRGNGVPPLRPGERWRLDVRLKRPHGYANFGGHDAEVAFLARGVRATGYVIAAEKAKRLPGVAGGVGTSIDRLRDALRKRIARTLTAASHRGIVQALAVGVQDAIAEADRVVLRRTGTSHLVAVSGLHVGFVAGLVGVLAGWLWRTSCGFGAILARRGAREWPLILPTPIVAAAVGVASAAAYAALAGFNVPAQRALWMLAVASVAFILGRRVAFSLVLAWAVVFVLIADPWAATAAGFWLSFGAVAFIALGMRGALHSREGDDGPHDPLESVRASDPGWQADGQPARGAGGSVWARRLRMMRRRCADAIRAQWAVTLGLAPLTAYWFSQVSLVGPLANAVAVPWVSIFVVPVVLVGTVLPAPLDALALRLAHALLEPLMQALGALARSSWADWHPARPSLWALACALVGVAWCLMPRGWPLRFAAPLAWLPLVVPRPSGVEEGAFRLTALDVGQGAAILVETHRRALLFDAGPGPESTHAGQRVVAPYLRAQGVARLDALLVSHGDADHAGGAGAVFESLRVRQLIGGLPPAHRLWTLAREHGAKPLRCAAGQRWRWDGVEFELLWPDPGPLPRRSNEQSCVLRVSARRASALLTGDIGAPTERALVNRSPDALRADVLLVAHHGSKTSSSQPFLDLVDPRVALLQLGYRNRFGHPHPHVWSRLDSRAIALARTDRDGAVRWESNRSEGPLERYRESHARYWMGPANH